MKPGKPCPYHADNVRGKLHVTQATLGIGSSSEKSILQCSSGHKSPVFLCSLLPDKVILRMMMGMILGMTMNMIHGGRILKELSQRSHLNMIVKMDMLMTSLLIVILTCTCLCQSQIVEL